MKPVVAIISSIFMLTSGTILAVDKITPVSPREGITTFELKKTKTYHYLETPP